MLCDACQDIFSAPRRLTCGEYYPWKQTPTSYAASLKAGCHLCNVIEEGRSYTSYATPGFPSGTRYAFKALGQDWARHGKGPQWLVPQLSGVHDLDMMEVYKQLADSDPTPNKLGQLLATDAEDAADQARKSWLVLELFGQNGHIVLPVELATDDQLENIAQVHLDKQISTSSVGSLDLARRWLRNCLVNHEACGSRETEPWVPTRLLDAGSHEIPVVRLVLGSSLRRDTPYLALSHRWGTETSCTLQSENFSMYRQGINPTRIPATVRDALEVTRALGFRYLWVDSMCIVQDDPEDWARESAAMSKVYGSATCTVAASNSGFGKAGCFSTRNPYRIRACRIPNPFNTNSKYSFYVRSQYLNNIHNREVRGSEWYNRGWVFQERILSSRMLLFSQTQVLWACEELQAAETWPCGKTTANYIDRFDSFAVEKARFMQLLHQSLGVRESHDAWWIFLQDYMSSQLTVTTDRLAALQGIVAIIENLTGQRYCSGFWLNQTFPSSLLWKTPENPKPRPNEYRAPSWSWASVEGKVVPNKDPETFTSLIKVEEHVRLTDGPASAESRAVREALRVSGTLLPAVLLTSSTDGKPGLMSPAAAEKWKEQEAAKRVAAAEARERLLPSLTCVILWLKKRGLLATLIVLSPAIAVLVIALLSVAVGLVLGAVPVVLVGYGLYFVGLAIWFQARRCGIHRDLVLCPFYGVAALVGLCFWGLVQCGRDVHAWWYRERIAREREEEAHRWHLEQAELSRRRDEARARAQRIFDDLERGIPLPALEAQHDGGTDPALDDSPIVVTISLDEPSHRLPTLTEVSCLPIITSGRGTGGLLLQRSREADGHWTRLGTFELNSHQLKKLPQPDGVETFLFI